MLLYTVNHTILFAAWNKEVIQIIIMNLWLARLIMIGGTCLHTFQQQKTASLTSSLHIYANITGKWITLIFFADFIFLK